MVHVKRKIPPSVVRSSTTGTQMARTGQDSKRSRTTRTAKVSFNKGSAKRKMHESGHTCCKSRGPCSVTIPRKLHQACRRLNTLGVTSSSIRLKQASVTSQVRLYDHAFHLQILTSLLVAGKEKEKNAHRGLSVSLSFTLTGCSCTAECTDGKHKKSDHGNRFSDH